MKNFYLAVVIAILLPISILAKPIGKHHAVNSSNYQSIDYSAYTIAESEIFDVKVGDFPAPQMAFNVFVQTAEYYWTTIFDGVTPITYEPKSGTLIYIATSRENVNDTAISHIDLYFSQNAGATWTTERVFTRKESILFFP